MLRVLSLLIFVAGCPASSSECKLPTGGSAFEAQLVVGDNNDAMQPVSDGSHITLRGAPQGGHILLVGARIHDDDECQLEATATLRDLAGTHVIGTDARTMHLEKTGDGWAQPHDDLSATPNVAVCPSSSSTAIFGNMYQLEIVLVDGAGTQVADVKANVIPTCDTGDQYCTEECAAGT